MSSSSWARLTNQASNWLGGKYTPRRSIAPWNRPNRSVSLRFADATSVTGPSAKKSDTIDPTRWTRAATPASRAASARPSARRAPAASSFS